MNGALCLTLSLFAAAPPAADLPPPVPKRFTRGATRLTADPEPKALAADVHFPTSNEEQHHLWREAVADLGGVYVGVGTDQNYLLAGWSRPEVLVAMDFDQAVVDLHLAYFALFRVARDAKEFVGLWAWKRKKEVVAILEKDLADPAERARVVKTFLEFRPAVELRLKHVRDAYREAKIPTFLDDPAQFQYLAALVRSGQAHAVRGDLTAGAALRDIGRLAQELGRPVRVLYLSNAERYFQYTPGFRSGVAALPFDERSVVLRTAGLGSDKSIDPYFYIVQKGPNFQEWTRDPKVPAVHVLNKRIKPASRRFLYTLEALPTDPPDPVPSPAKARASK